MPETAIPRGGSMATEGKAHMRGRDTFTETHTEKHKQTEIGIHGGRGGAAL